MANGPVGYGKCKSTLHNLDPPSWVIICTLYLLPRDVSLVTRHVITWVISYLGFQAQANTHLVCGV